MSRLIKAEATGISSGCLPMVTFESMSLSPHYHLDPSHTQGPESNQSGGKNKRAAVKYNLKACWAGVGTTAVFSEKTQHSEFLN